MLATDCISNVAKDEPDDVVSFPGLVVPRSKPEGRSSPDGAGDGNPWDVVGLLVVEDMALMYPGNSDQRNVPNSLLVGLLDK